MTFKWKYAVTYAVIFSIWFILLDLAKEWATLQKLVHVFKPKIQRLQTKKEKSKCDPLHPKITRTENLSKRDEKRDKEGNHTNVAKEHWQESLFSFALLH